MPVDPLHHLFPDMLVAGQLLMTANYPNDLTDIHSGSLQIESPTKLSIADDIDTSIRSLGKFINPWTALAQVARKVELASDQGICP